MKSITLKFGLLTGIVIMTYFFGVFLLVGDFSKLSPTEFKTVEILGYLRYLIMVLAIVFAMRTYKKQHPFPATYKNLLNQGFMVVLVISVCIGFMEFLYILINPDFYDEYSRFYLEQLRRSNASIEQIRDVQSEMAKYSWMQIPWKTGIFYFFEAIVIGGVVTLILGLLLKSKQLKAAV